jgi:hypothetical protein
MEHGQSERSFFQMFEIRKEDADDRRCRYEIVPLLNRQLALA